MEDLDEEFRLPIRHRPTENLDTENTEQASLDTKLTSSNVGFRLLQKMGWKGKGLGKDEQGIVEPIRAGIRDPKLGVGKQEQDDFFTSEENVQRRKLEIEVEETEEQAKRREVVAERELKIQSEVKEIKKVFFCSLCSKQYKLAVEFEAHLSSYDHNHRKRFKEMKEMHGSSSRDERLRREQLRHEKEIARFAQLYAHISLSSSTSPLLLLLLLLYVVLSSGQGGAATAEARWRRRDGGGGAGATPDAQIRVRLSAGIVKGHRRRRLRRQATQDRPQNQLRLRRRQRRRRAVASSSQLPCRRRPTSFLP